MEVQRSASEISGSTDARCSNLPSGCYFHPRCPYAIDRCQTEAPALREIGTGRKVACHLAEQVKLRGVHTA
ncbi:MAG TPA: oligopeptide/dipeptide ABC transporter ATP-binding protein [Anaerolineales bacterium]|nr:oligopeptide/dipeptide ABC transporter ATP-binding protein [Anaerolineales bacterium]